MPVVRIEIEDDDAATTSTTMAPGPRPAGVMALVGGIFCAFSSFVMKALARFDTVLASYATHGKTLGRRNDTP